MMVRPNQNSCIVFMLCARALDRPGRARKPKKACDLSWRSTGRAKTHYACAIMLTQAGASGCMQPADHPTGPYGAVCDARMVSLFRCLSRWEAPRARRRPSSASRKANGVPGPQARGRAPGLQLPNPPLDVNISRRSRTGSNPRRFSISRNVRDS